MAITALGTASGLDLESLVKQLVQVERASKESRLEKVSKGLDSSLSGFGKLKSALSKFQDSVKALSTENLSARTTTVKQPTDDKTYLEAKAKTTSATGSFDIKVNALAEGSRLETAGGAFASASSIVSTTAGKMTFSAGTKSFEVNVTANMTLDQLRQKINSTGSNFGVSANLINSSDTGTKLVLTSNVTGLGNNLTVTNNNAELNSVSTGGLVVAKNAADAVITIDGILTKSKTNVFSNAIQDVELTVSTITPDGNNARMTIATDKKQAEDKIKTFMDSYNALVTEVDTLSRNRMLSTDGKTVILEGGDLNGDSMVRGIMSQVSSIMTGAVKSADPKLNNLYALGITFTDQGKMEIQAKSSFGNLSGRERLDKALDENYDLIGSLFTSKDGLGTLSTKLSTEFTQRGGLLAGKEESLKAEIRKNGKDKEAFELYMFSFESTMRQRYGALDSQLGGLQRTSSFLSQQLASLPKIGG
ncbi:flagellar cap protein [Rheinheimera riviphila]|uniref:Flagellar hook-associated protein 2 n=1 Tax=Rheinheimera riviphila TaxID=1834037 RepID=A0A437QJ84_9GAMM|nr:flagellar filament capping protein FliD [Rheinheimera riviphila]RVU34560.1 flagellar cap protein [Rheinheimera riviphila]